MAWLDYTGLSRFLVLLKSNIKMSETRYIYTTETTETVSFTVPDFNASTCTLDVYVNGLHCIPTVDYTLSGNTLVMLNELDVGQTCEFVVRRVSL